jgi:phosphoserine phosphatase
MRLLLVRHGESTWNAQGRYQGRLDPPLSQRGREQAQALAARLEALSREGPAEHRVRAIVSSPLQRARDTAQVCAQALGLGLTVDERLTEISHGEWQGLLREEIEVRWPDMVASWRSTPDLVTFPGGEKLADVRERVVAFLADPLLNVPGPVLVATHDVIVRIAILIARGKPLSAFNEVRVDNAAISELSLEDGTLTELRINDASHLGSLRSDTLTQAL